MSDARRTPLSALAESWRDAARDMVLIVVSILIAFALNAWWDSRIDRQEEAHLLTDLDREFGAVRNEFDRVYNYHVDKLDAARALLTFVGRPRADSQEDSILKVFRATLGSRTFDPPQGVTDGIIMSGKLDLLRDDTLSHLLAGFRSQIDNLAKTEENLRLVYRDAILPWLQDRTPMPLGDSVGRVFKPNLDTLLDSYAFDNRVRFLIGQTKLILVEGAPVSATIDSIRSRLAPRSHQ